MKVNLFLIYFLFSFKAYAICHDKALKEAIMLDEVQLISFSKCYSLKSISDQKLLHMAIDLNSLKVARHLLDLGLEVNAIDDSGRTPLYFVHHLEAVQLLSNFGADFNHIDNNGGSPLLAAMKRGEFEMMKELFHHGSDITANEIGFASKTNDFLTLDFLSKNAKSRFIRGSGLYFKDFSFGEIRYQKIAKRLIDLGADLNLHENSLLRPYLVNSLENKKSALSAIYFLISLGADISRL